MPFVIEVRNDSQVRSATRAIQPSGLLIFMVNVFRLILSFKANNLAGYKVEEHRETT